MTNELTEFEKLEIRQRISNLVLACVFGILDPPPKEEEKE